MIIAANVRRLIILIAQEATATYIRGEGACCPVCERLGRERIRCSCNRTERLGGSVVRFHRCEVCGHTFKSVEDPVPLEPDPIRRSGRSPESMAGNPSKGQNKAKKR